ncbi:type II toxin-antitoxin system RatA family toxin [Candidatus Phycosocius spiralis]|uniref:Ubiquinone-binding protein n=1 Tax=Candidatus Phycosocius spiralis TaxID=2815099 RepID=A0ABQ4PSL8_9PROT|nr:type II toxin-antitoxin system RatA family toxin [Candidatus Phycosocius spiralis]GIU65976.1 ubiquinone-binding protein [Candidatus Phycosocius spiralis]
MNHFETTELLEFAPDDLLKLVSDVPAYSSFLPWIKASRISQEKQTETGRYFVGEAVIGYKAFRAQFSTHVEVNRVARTIQTNLIQGPFKSLTCMWQFMPSQSGTLVDLTLDFEFSELFLSTLLSANLNTAVSRLMIAFTREAEKRYTVVH